MQRVDQLIGQFLKLNYGLSLRTVYGYLKPRPTARSYEPVLWRRWQRGRRLSRCLGPEGLLARHYGPQFRMSAKDTARLQLHMRLGAQAEREGKEGRHCRANL